MVRDSSRHPDGEVLAAFVAGSLAGEELEMTVEHLRTCEDCRIEVAEGARYEREHPPQAAPQLAPQLAPMAKVVPIAARKQPPAWQMIIAAAGIAGLAFLAIAVYSAWNNPMRKLIAAAPDARYLEARLSGNFPWAPLRSIPRDPDRPPDPEYMRLVGAAGEVLQKTANDRSADARHAAAVANLLGGHPKDAARLLTELAASSNEAKVWSDLAAARYAATVQAEDPPQLAQALAAADAALRLNPRQPEALFNRALILEHLGLREQARAAWKQYLAADPESKWAREAESHLRALSTTSEFRDELERGYAVFTRDGAAARGLVQRFPQDARVWGESEILSRWARSETAGDSAAAGAHLQLARTFGDELARSHGERLLQAAVARIDEADADRRKMLAAAHIRFREAQKTYKGGHPAEAERMFEEAAAQFEQAGSPMALLGRYFAANTAFDQGRIEEARGKLERLLAAAPPDFVAYRAQLQWELGMAYASLGRWGQAMGALGESIAGFERLGERNYAMTVREILAEAYDRLGEPRQGWSHRIIALQELGRKEDLRLQIAIHAAARAAALKRDWPVSLSFLNLQTDMARRAGDEQMYIDTLLLRARIEGRMDQEKAALDDLSRAAAAMARLNDGALRARAEADRLAVQGFLAASPTDAVTLLGRAIEFHQARGRRMFLPELLLHRGRALAALGRPAEAASDFEAGIRELEAERMSLDPGDQRWGMFAAADELFDEAVALALQRQDVAAAFAYSERARARELLDSMGAASVPASQPLAGGVVLLEYVVLPEKLVIFVVQGTRISAVQSSVAAVAVAGEVESLTRSAMAGDGAEFRRVAARLYGRLVAPVSGDLGPAGTVVFVPDRTLSVVPFAALIDTAGRHVIERHSVVIAPSVAVFSRLAAERRAMGKSPRLLMVAGPTVREGDPGRLTAEQREIDSVAAEYGENVAFAPNSDDRDVLEQAAAKADVIHFVGHAVVPDASAEGALVTSRREGPEGKLDVREVASMSLRHTSAIVLAACGTARDRELPGEASISLARAFLAAGVPSVVATLWPIDDALAAEFFPRLHHYLARGMPPAEAVRAAQLEWVRRPDAPPGVWAAVQMIGS